MTVAELVVEQWAEDIACLRLPLPAFGGVNALVLGSRDQVVVDTGMPDAETAAIWQSALQTDLLGDVEAVLCTHAHIDHVGQAGLLANATGAVLLMSAAEYEDAVGLSRTGSEERQRVDALFLEEGGFSSEGRSRPTDYRVLAPFPDRVRLLDDRATVNLGGIDFEVWLGGGHSRAPVCLLSLERKLLLVGDQVLAGSGPQIPVQAERPREDVLGAYFAFLDRLDTLPDDLTVFPAHGDPISGLKQQVSRIRNAHRLRLERLLDRIDGEMTCAELAPLIFGDPSSRLSARLPYLLRAYVNFLALRGWLRVTEEAGVLRFRSWK